MRAAFEQDISYSRLLTSAFGAKRAAACALLSSSVGLDFPLTNTESEKRESSLQGKGLKLGEIPNGRSCLLLRLQPDFAASCLTIACSCSKLQARRPERRRRALRASPYATLQIQRQGMLGFSVHFWSLTTHFG